MLEGFSKDYKQTSAYFQSIVKASNPLMPFYVSLVNRQEQPSFSKQPSFLNLLFLLTNQIENACDKCGIVFAQRRTLKQHISCTSNLDLAETVRSEWYCLLSSIQIVALINHISMTSISHIRCYLMHTPRLGCYHLTSPLFMVIYDLT